MKLGIAGTITRTFIDSPLTPLLLLTAIALGILALLQLPCEEEPQIRVPMVDIHVQANGLKATDAVELVTEPLEDIVKGIDDVDNKNAIRSALGTPTPDRLLKLAQAMRLGYSDELIFEACRIDPWFIAQIRGIIDMEGQIEK